MTQQPLLGLYLEKNMTRKDTCMSMLIAALFTRAKAWKPPNCLLTAEW